MPLVVGAMMIIPATGASAVTITQSSHFLLYDNGSNTSGDSLYIDNAATNNRPNDLLFVTPNYDPGGVGSAYDSIPVGVWYDTIADQWAVFNEDESTMSAGETFNVLAVPGTKSNVFVHTSSAGNIVGDSTYINSSLTNGKPGVMLQVTQNYDPGGSGASEDTDTVGVWYNSHKKEWAIFNENLSAMLTGTTFNVLVGTASTGGGASAAVQKAGIHRVGDTTYINNTKTNGNPNAFVFATPNYNPGGVGGTLDDIPAGVWYDTSAVKEGVSNEDGSAMPLNAAFNLLIYQG